MKESNVLYVDTAVETCQIIYSQKGTVVFNFLSPISKKGHAEIFFEKINDLKNKFPDIFETLETLVVNIGPGRFNALRVGVGFALTVKSLFDIELKSINSFDILKNCSEDLNIDGFEKADFAIFAKWNHAYYLKNLVLKPSLLSYEGIDWSNTICLGVPETQNSKHSFSALSVAHFEKLYSKAVFIEDVYKLEPIYLGHQIEV